MPDQVLTDSDVRHIERENIIAAMRRMKWQVGGEGGSAELPGIKSTTLASRIKKLGIERPV